MKVTEGQCKVGIMIGLVVGVAIPILLIIAPFIYSMASFVSETLNQESLVQEIKVAQHLTTVEYVAVTIGPLILVASWFLLKQKRKEEEIRYRNKEPNR
jgi:uncharacterized protein YqgC (DUF456 family)